MCGEGLEMPPPESKKKKKNVATGERVRQEGEFCCWAELAGGMDGEMEGCGTDPTIQSQQRTRTCVSRDVTLALGRWRKIRSSQGHSQSQSKFKASLHYLKPVLERKKKDRVGA